MGTDDNGPFKLPASKINFEGKPRRVGMEFEFAGVDIKDAADLVAAAFEGIVVEKNSFVYEVEGTVFGKFGVELDSGFLKERRYEAFLNALGLRELSGRSVDEALMALSEVAVPIEVVTPPITFDSLRVFDELREMLKRRKALGTRASLIYAFGLHINTEIASAEPIELLNVLRSFLLLYDWLKKSSDVDPPRQLTPYIDPFPERYVRKVLAPGYRPSGDELIDDYLADNPTRNRALDLLPIFAHLDELKVKAAVKEPELVNARPAYHYRLPNCRIDEAGWSVADEWNRWVCVENLAADTEQLEKRSLEYLKEGISVGDWVRDLFR